MTDQLINKRATAFSNEELTGSSIVWIFSTFQVSICNQFSAVPTSGGQVDTHLFCYFGDAQTFLNSNERHDVSGRPFQSFGGLRTIATNCSLESD